MRRLLPSAALLLLSACASGPAAEPELPPVASAPAPVRVEHGDLIGLDPSELVSRLGAPALQIREGTSVKLQFRNRSCVLDAYLYPGAGGLRVTHVDARAPSGVDTNQAVCISTFATAS